MAVAIAAEVMTRAAAAANSFEPMSVANVIVLSPFDMCVMCWDAQAIRFGLAGMIV